MLSRHDIHDEHWDRIRHLLPGQAGGHGGVGNDTRRFVDAIRSLAKTGIAWADLPTCSGTPNSLWPRYHRWCERGVRARVAAELRDDDTEWLSVDTTCVRASVAAAGAKKSRRHRRSGGRGGFGTKVDGGRTPLGHPAARKPTGAAAADGPHLPGLIAGIETAAVPADKGDDADANRRAIRRRGGPNRASRRGRTAERRSTTTGTSTRSGTWPSGSSGGSSSAAGWRRGSTRRPRTTWASSGWRRSI